MCGIRLGLQAVGVCSRTTTVLVTAEFCSLMGIHLELLRSRLLDTGGGISRYHRECSSGYGRRYFKNIPGGTLIGNLSTSGMYFFSDTAKKLTQKISGYSVTKYQDVPGGCLCMSSRVWLYDYASATAIQKYTTSNGNMDTPYPVKDAVLIGGTGGRLLLYNNVTQTVSEIFGSSSVAHWRNFLQTDGAVLISSDLSSGSSSGYESDSLLKYDENIKTIKVISRATDQYGREWKYIYKMDTMYLLFRDDPNYGGASKDILFYNPDTDNVYLLDFAMYRALIDPNVGVYNNVVYARKG